MSAVTETSATRATAPSRRAATGSGRQSGPRRPVPLIKYGYWWWALPAIVLVLAMVYVTTASGAFFAFTNWTGIGAFQITGLANFQRIFTTPALSGALWHTLVIAFAFVILTNVLGLLFALALNRTLKTRYILRVLLFMPVVLSPIAVSYIWKFVFAFNGPLNVVLGAVGLGSLKHSWLADPVSALISVIVVMVWQNIGLVAVIYLAGLATVPQELEEAASLDGAGTWGRFRNVVAPMIRPSLAIATTLMLVQGLRIFDQIMALTNGGPFGATETLATQIYKQTFTYGQFGFGAALALVLTIIILVFAVAQQFITDL